MEYKGGEIMIEYDPFTGMAFLFIGLIIYGTVMTIVWMYAKPYLRWNNYLQSYRIGKLVKHAAANETKFVFEKPLKKYELEEIDEQFDKAEKISKEIHEIDAAYSTKA